ncbi:MAG: 30S ribosomal protein S17 [Verrucomicrobiae bacterium]|nr:30S ribosomal protein S17 [Verrucomicrobiae bacterium]
MTSPDQPHRGARKERIGRVVSDKMDKTIVVCVDRRVRHAIYEKVVTRSTRFHTHDEKNEAKVGDRVRIMETRPLSRLKRWRLVEILERAEAPGPEIKNAVEEAAASA